MRLRLLLINPWVYDFAATNLWSKPLGLFSVAECLNAYDVSCCLIDCMDVYKPIRFGKGIYPKAILEKPACLKAVPRKYGRYGISIEEFRQRLCSRGPYDAVLVTSIMSYWYPGVQQVIRIVRQTYGKIPVILGGIYATLWHRHASDTSGADFIYHGPVGNAITFALSTFGFRLKKKRNRGTTDNFRFQPFFDAGDPAAASSLESFAPIMTSSGCPFSCSYCGSNLLQPVCHQKPVHDIVEQISAIAGRGVRDFAFYDDALLMHADAHIKPILRAVLRNHQDLRFHCPNGLHARFIDDELAYLMRKAGFATLRLSLESIDRERQKHTGGKVSSDDLVNAVSLLKKHSFTKESIGVYLMYGLPGQSLQEVRDGITFLKGLDVRINLTEFSPVPGTACWQELIRQGTITDDLDPLLTNNSVFSYLYSAYDPGDVNRMRLDVKKYNALKEQSV